MLFFEMLLPGWKNVFQNLLHFNGFKKGVSVLLKSSNFSLAKSLRPKNKVINLYNPFTNFLSHMIDQFCLLNLNQL